MKTTSDSGTSYLFLKPEVAVEMQADHLEPQKSHARCLVEAALPSMGQPGWHTGDPG